MSIEELLKKHQGNQPEETADAEAVEDQGVYGLVRAPRERAIMLELRKKDGAVLAVPYALIEFITFSPADGIMISACGREIKVVGRALNLAKAPRMSLFVALCRHRIAWLSESGRQGIHSSDDDFATIDSLKW